MKFDIPYSRLDPVYWDGQERRAHSDIYGYDWMGVPKFPYLSSNNGKFSKISFLFLYYSIKFEKSQMFVCNKKSGGIFPPLFKYTLFGQ